MPPDGVSIVADVRARSQVAVRSTRERELSPRCDGRMAAGLLRPPGVRSSAVSLCAAAGGCVGATPRNRYAGRAPSGSVLEVFSQAWISSVCWPGVGGGST